MSMFENTVQIGTVFSRTVWTKSKTHDKWLEDSNVDSVPSSGRIVTVSDPEYPNQLRWLSYIPTVFEVIGKPWAPEDASAVSIVGSRKSSDGALRVAETVAAKLATNGHSVISGLAAGIDAAAHRGALNAGGRTIAVMGTGTNTTYPTVNLELRKKIEERGAVFSQFHPIQGPSRYSFNARNSVIAGLGIVSLVIECKEASGTRNEMKLATAHNRKVLLWEPLLGHGNWARLLVSQGGAHFVSSIEDIEQFLFEYAKTGKR